MCLAAGRLLQLLSWPRVGTLLVLPMLLWGVLRMLANVS